MHVPITNMHCFQNNTGNSQDRIGNRIRMIQMDLSALIPEANCSLREPLRVKLGTPHRLGATQQAAAHPTESSCSEPPCQSHLARK